MSPENGATITSALVHLGNINPVPPQTRIDAGPTTESNGGDHGVLYAPAHPPLISISGGTTMKAKATTS